MKRVITFGTFDLFHIGHLNILERARAQGDSLVVGVSSDQMNFSKKGFVPIFPLEERLRIIGALRCVDSAFVEDSLEKKRQYILEHAAAILVMGADWEGKFDELDDICKVVYLPRTNDISTTALKERLRYPV